MTARKKGVLIVDDEPILREALKRLLIHDFEMCLADSGHKALELLASRGCVVSGVEPDMPVPHSRSFTPAYADRP